MNGIAYPDGGVLVGQAPPQRMSDSREAGFSTGTASASNTLARRSGRRLRGALFFRDGTQGSLSIR